MYVWVLYNISNFVHKIHLTTNYFRKFALKDYIVFEIDITTKLFLPRNKKWKIKFYPYIYNFYSITIIKKMYDMIYSRILITFYFLNFLT